MNILSFGEIIYDFYGDKKFLGGAPLNLAAHAVLCGAKASLYSAVGDDEIGEEAAAEAKKRGISTNYIAKVPNKPTGKCMVTLSENAVPKYDLLSDTAYDFIPYQKIDNNFDLIAFGTLALRSKTSFDTLKRLIEENNFADIYADINIRQPFSTDESIRFCVNNATILKISDEELPFAEKILFGKSLKQDELFSVFCTTFTNLRLIILTCGSKGAYVYDCVSEKSYFQESVKTEVVSTTGAGDSFGAAFLARYFETDDIEKSLELAARVSACVVSQNAAVPLYKINGMTVIPE